MPPIFALEPDAVAFDDELVNRYTSEMTVRLSDRAVKPSDVEADADSDTSGSDGSVDFSLRMRRFQPMALVDMRAEDSDIHHSAPNVRREVATSMKASVAISDSDSDNEGPDVIADQIKTSAVSAPLFPQGRVTAAAKVASAPIVRRGLALNLAPNLAFSPMRTGSATQKAARSRDIASSDDASDDAR
jgi:hypothetical protein